MLVHSPRNLTYSKKLQFFSYYLNKEGKRRQDPDTRKAIFNDAKLIKGMADALQKHNPAKAAQIMFGMDRFLIDIMPLDIFHYLEDYYSR